MRRLLVFSLRSISAWNHGNICGFKALVHKLIHHIWEITDQKILSAEILWPRLRNVSPQAGAWHIKRTPPSLKIENTHQVLQLICNLVTLWHQSTAVPVTAVGLWRKSIARSEDPSSVDVCQIAVLSRKDKTAWRRWAMFGLPQVNKPQRGLHMFVLVPSVCQMVVLLM